MWMENGSSSERKGALTIDYSGVGILDPLHSLTLSKVHFQIMKQMEIQNYLLPIINLIQIIQYHLNYLIPLRHQSPRAGLSIYPFDFTSYLTKRCLKFLSKFVRCSHRQQKDAEYGARLMQITEVNASNSLVKQVVFC